LQSYSKSHDHDVWWVLDKACASINIMKAGSVVTSEELASEDLCSRPIALQVAVRNLESPLAKLLVACQRASLEQQAGVALKLEMHILEWR